MKTKAMFWIIVAIAAASACATGGGPKPRLHKASQDPKPSPVIAKTSAPSASGAETGTSLPAEPPKPDVGKIIARLLGENPAFSPEDSAAADQLASTIQPGSLEEAVVAIVCLYESLPDLSNRKSEFSEADLVPSTPHAPPPSSAMTSESLEVLTGKRHLALAQALASNSLLQSSKVQSWAVRSVEGPGISEGFRASILAAVTAQTQVWNDLEAKLGVSSKPAAPVVATEAPAQGSKEPEPTTQKEIQPALKFGAGEFGSDDQVMQDAQSLADKGQFKQAVTKLSQLREDSPQFAAGQERIRDYSNKAVQELRRLAAKAFQSAIPVTDLSAKAEYLKEARAHLESALSGYPQADQLATVRENLAVINRDLLKISESQGGK